MKSINIDDDIHYELKVMSARNQMKLAEYTNKLLRDQLFTIKHIEEKISYIDNYIDEEVEDEETRKYLKESFRDC